jgi:hypothetical protein
MNTLAYADSSLRRPRRLGVALWASTAVGLVLSLVLLAVGAGTGDAVYQDGEGGTWVPLSAFDRQVVIDDEQRPALQAFLVQLSVEEPGSWAVGGSPMPEILDGRRAGSGTFVFATERGEISITGSTARWVRPDGTHIERTVTPYGQHRPSLSWAKVTSLVDIGGVALRVVSCETAWWIQFKRVVTVLVLASALFAGGFGFWAWRMARGNYDVMKYYWWWMLGLSGACVVLGTTLQAWRVHEQGATVTTLPLIWTKASTRELLGLGVWSCFGGAAVLMGCAVIFGLERVWGYWRTRFGGPPPWERSKG